MKRADLLSWLEEQYGQWEALLEEIGPARMEQPGVNGDWSMTDIVAHLTGWNRALVARLQAAQRGEPEPRPPWPAHLEDEDAINAWIYETNRGRPAAEVLDEMRRLHRQLVAVVESLPDDVRIEVIEPAFYLPWIGDRRYHVGEFFDHFRDDHEADVRAWLARVETA